MLMNKIEVTVIIPTYNGSNTISRALHSLTNQTYKSFEVIVVDDNGKGSNRQKQTEIEVMKYSQSLDLKYLVHEKNLNGAAARNTGLKEANGDFICFLDDDDVYLKNRLLKATNILKKNKSADLLFCAVLIQRNGKLVNIVRPHNASNMQRELLLNTALFGTGSNIFMRREILNKVGGFNEKYFRRQDNEFLLRALEDGTYIMTNDIDIVKCNSGVLNLPSYEKMRISNELYYNDFKKLIDSFNEEDYTLFQQKERAWLLFCCMMREKQEIIEEAKTALLEYRNLKVSEKIQYSMAKIKFKNSNLLYYIQPQMSKVRNEMKSRRIRKKLTKDMENQLLELNIIN